MPLNRATYNLSTVAQITIHHTKCECEGDRTDRKFEPLLICLPWLSLVVFFLRGDGFDMPSGAKLNKPSGLAPEDFQLGQLI